MTYRGRVSTNTNSKGQLLGQAIKAAVCYLVIIMCVSCFYSLIIPVCMVLCNLPLKTQLTEQDMTEVEGTEVEGAMSPVSMGQFIQG